jgi:hypothetical protein
MPLLPLWMSQPRLFWVYSWIPHCRQYRAWGILPIFNDFRSDSQGEHVLLSSKIDIDSVVIQAQIKFFLDNWAVIRSSDAMTNVWQQIRSGRHPGFEEGLWTTCGHNDSLVLLQQSGPSSCPICKLCPCLPTVPRWVTVLIAGNYLFNCLGLMQEPSTANGWKYLKHNLFG